MTYENTEKNLFSCDCSLTKVVVHNVKMWTNSHLCIRSPFSVSLKEVKAFLPRLNYKIPTNKLRDIFNDVDKRKRGEIGFDDFTILYHTIIFDENVSKPKLSTLLTRISCILVFSEHS